MATTRRRTTRKPDNVDRGMQFLERFGLPTAALIGIAYVGFTMIVQPLVKTYQESIAAVAVTADEMQDAIEADNLADAERVKEIVESLKALEMKIDSALMKLRSGDEQD